MHVLVIVLLCLPVVLVSGVCQKDTFCLEMKETEFSFGSKHIHEPKINITGKRMKSGGHEWTYDLLHLNFDANHHHIPFNMTLSFHDTVTKKFVDIKLQRHEDGKGEAECTVSEVIRHDEPLDLSDGCIVHEDKPDHIILHTNDTIANASHWDTRPLEVMGHLEWRDADKVMRADTSWSQEYLIFEGTDRKGSSADDPQTEHLLMMALVILIVVVFVMLLCVCILCIKNRKTEAEPTLIPQTTIGELKTQKSNESLKARSSLAPKSSKKPK